MTHGFIDRRGSKKRLGAMEFALIFSLAIFSLPSLVEFVARLGG